MSRQEYVEPNSEKYLSLEDLPNEIWKDIKGYEGLYQVSNYGRIKYLERIAYKNNRFYSTHIMKLHFNTKKYLDVELSKKGIKHRYRVHRLVAEAFIPNLNNLPQVNHIDCNKANNYVNNLEWCNNSENQIHAYKNGLNIRKKLGESPRAKVVLQFDKEGNLIKEWDCLTRIEKELGYNSSSISYCCSGKYKQCYGYIWKYRKDINYE